VTALDRVLGKKSNEMTEVFNLGTGKGNSVMEVIRSFEKVSGTKLNYKIGPRREGDVVSIYSDTKKANEVLGWKAERDINDMMLTSWNWQNAISLKK
jgi:UDP-glucose 4-epimerase